MPKTLVRIVLLSFPMLLGMSLAVVAQPQGFTSLFNGKDLTGWKGRVNDPPGRAKMSPAELARAQKSADESMNEHWRVEAGALVFDGKGDNLATVKDYADFELLVEWKIEGTGDSGIYLRGTPQVQIWESPVGSGGLHNNLKNASKPTKKADRPVGDWNAFRILMVGDRVTVNLNGEQIVDKVVMENYWDRSQPIYPGGAIELQSEGSRVHFRNIYVRELPCVEGGRAPDCVLKKGARVAIVGDSITEQKLYSRFMEAYLIACLAGLDLRVIQLGWGGERAPGFAARMENDLMPWKPDVVTTCYGMNDGSYRKYEKPIGDAYEKSMAEIVQRLKSAGVTAVVGSPGAVDFNSFKKLSPTDYNANLAELRDIAKTIARAEGMPFADVHGSMVEAMTRAKPVLGENYDVCGSDGFHPNANGHILMAYAFLRAMGCDGDLGSITVDMKGFATAEGGHLVLASSPGRAQVESRRYPFCFDGDGKSPSSTRSIVPFTPFNEHLNRLILTVRGLSSGRAKVRWGSAVMSFSKEKLEKGINLAAEFLENPFSEPFRKVDELVGNKQAFETQVIKEGITSFRRVRDLLGGEDAEARKALDIVRQRLYAKVDPLHEAVRAAVTPVRHEIVVDAE